MKFIHIADVHLGAKPDQEKPWGKERENHSWQAFADVITKAGEEQVQLLLIAGDLFHRHPLLRELKEVNYQFSRIPRTQVVMIAGEHEYLNDHSYFGAFPWGENVHFLKEEKVDYVELEGLCTRVYGLSYHHRNIYENLCENITLKEDGYCNIFLAHGGDEEHLPFQVKELERMNFDYVALGHIHSPQHVGRDTLRYCGTPLKYSFSEAEQEKSVTVVELREKGEVELRQIPLTPLRDMRRIRGTYMEVMDRNFYQGTNREDYVQITLTDEEDVPDGLQRLRKVYPNLMRLVYDNARTRQSREVGAAEELERKSELELFSDFYVLQNNQTMSAKQTELVRQLIQESMGCT